MNDSSVRGGETANFDVVLAGHILNERVVFQDRVLYPVLGSPVAYSSVCLGKLGSTVGIVTKIGEDFPDHLLNVFREVGVDTGGIKVGSVSTRDELIYHQDGRKTLKYISRAPKVRYEDFPRRYLKARILYVCPMDHEVDIDTIRQLSLLRRTMMVDLGGFGGATSGDHPLAKEGQELQALCPYFDVVKASIEDLGYILGVKLGDEKLVADQMLQWGARTVVITLGRDGAYIRTPEKGMWLPAYVQRAAEVVDQTGAGDCFSAGFLRDYTATGNPFLAALYGCAVTSFVIERSGGVVAARMPSETDANQRAEDMRSRLAITW
jgi:sugar/nucleoside kinase (ribokinase family)